jgi:hypothetical protein
MRCKCCRLPVGNWIHTNPEQLGHHHFIEETAQYKPSLEERIKFLENRVACLEQK